MSKEVSMASFRSELLDAYRRCKPAVVAVFQSEGCRTECIYSFFDFIDGVNPSKRIRIMSKVMSL